MSELKPALVDMSPAAVTRRVEMVEQLRVLCLELGKSKLVPNPEKPSNEAPRRKE